MNDGPTIFSSSAGGGLATESLDARVVLLGRTDLDARLRLDPTVELIRVRAGFDVLGELANPVLPVPPRTLVIVGRSADVDATQGGAAAFVTAVKTVAPEAAVLICEQLAANPRDPGPYDGVVSQNPSPDALRQLVHGDEPSPTMPGRLAADPGHTPETGAHQEPDAMLDDDGPGRPAPSPPSESQRQPRHESHRPPADPAPTGGVEIDADELAALREPVPTDEEDGTPAAGVWPHEIKPVASSSAESPAPPQGGDDVLVAALLSGRDLVEPAMGLIRARTGQTASEFVAAEDGQPSPANGAAVAWHGSLYGWLVSDGPSASLEGPARWLASWLALADQHRRLRLEAMTDTVSGAWNRRYFDRFLEAAIPHARAKRHKLTVLVFDLDNFKSFNDRFGHEAGDAILAETVALMRSMTRPSDRICRIGGDEFAVVFYEPEGPRDKHSDHPEDFEAVAERFQRAVLEQRFPKLGIELPGELTISGGLATFPWDGQSAADLLRCADLRALESKRAGKNAITFGGEPDEPSA